jgi:hypothetical protein
LRRCGWGPLSTVRLIAGSSPFLGVFVLRALIFEILRRHFGTL